MNLVRQLTKWSLVVLTLVSLLLSSTTFLAVASHNFSDVPDSLGVFHSAVEWMKNRQITSGCTSTLYCPDNPVTRIQMALFMQRLGGILTPGGIYGNQVLGPIEIDTGPGPGGGAITCMTTGVASATYPRSAVLFARASIFGASHSYTMAPIVSSNGGATWAYTDSYVYAIASPANDYAHTSYSVDYSMNTGTTYLFGIEIGRASGSADPTAGTCNIQVAVFNRNPSTSPLAPAAPITPQQKGRP